MNAKRLLSLSLKEIRSYFNSLSGFVSLALFGLFACYLYVRVAFLAEDGSMRQFFDVTSWLFLILVPALGMGAISTEKRSNTLEVLFALPITKSEIILSKYFALFFMCLLALGMTLIIPITLLFISTPHLPTIIVSYIGLLLLGGMMSSIVILFSSYTPSQIIAFLMSTLTIFCLFVLGSDFFSSIMPSILRSTFAFVSPLQQVAPFLKGVVDFRAVAYFISVTIFCLLVANRVISHKK